MAQTNFTPILLYASSTPTNVPSAGNLTNSATGSEIAINIADKNLFFKDSGGIVNTVPIRQSGTSSNGWLSATDWNTFNNKAPATSGTSILYGNGSGGFSNVTIGTGISFAGGTLSATGSGGTVTSVSGTAPVVSSGGTTPAISMPKATTSVDGYLSATDWTTFNNKQPAGTYVTSVGATSPVTSSGGTTPTIAMPAATTSVNGYLTSTDWNTFNNKGSGTVTSVTGTAPVVSSGGATPAISMAAATGSVNGYLTSTDWTTFNNKAPSVTFTANYIPYGQGTTTLNQSAGLQFDGTNFTTTGSVKTSQTAGIIGTTTNNDANAGSIGEYIAASVLLASAVSLTNNVSATITSISLTAGDWDVWGMIGLNQAAATIVSHASFGAGTSSSAVVAGNGAAVLYPPNGTAITPQTPFIQRRLSLSATTTVYLNIQAGFTISTLTAFGLIAARRRR